MLMNGKSILKGEIFHHLSTEGYKQIARSVVFRSANRAKKTSSHSCFGKRSTLPTIRKASTCSPHSLANHRGLSRLAPFSTGGAIEAQPCPTPSEEEAADIMTQDTLTFLFHNFQFIDYKREEKLLSTLKISDPAPSMFTPHQVALPTYPQPPHPSPLFQSCVTIHRPEQYKSDSVLLLWLMKYGEQCRLVFGCLHL